MSTIKEFLFSWAFVHLTFPLLLEQKSQRSFRQHFFDSRYYSRCMCCTESPSSASNAGGGLAHVCWHRFTSLDTLHLHLAMRVRCWFSSHTLTSPLIFQPIMEPLVLFRSKSNLKNLREVVDFDVNF